METDEGIDFLDVLKVENKNILNIDIGTKLHLEIEGIEFPVSSFFIGMVSNEYIIVASPSKFNMVKDKCFPGNMFIVKFLYAGIVYAFQTKLIDCITQSIRVVVLEYPKLIQSHQLRNLKRNTAFIPAKIENKKEITTGVIVDVNKKGCCCMLNGQQTGRKPLYKFDLITLRPQFPGVDGERQIDGKIKNVSKKGNELFVGIEFSNVSDETEKIIANYVFTIEEFT
ncbi:MAG: flagellar brake protein [Desulfobacterales bacterium]|nr:flagellar brake protein [Desulfobacterales bacterium]